MRGVMESKDPPSIPLLPYFNLNYIHTLYSFIPLFDLRDSLRHKNHPLLKTWLKLHNFDHKHDPYISPLPSLKKGPRRGFPPFLAFLPKLREEKHDFIKSFHGSNMLLKHTLSFTLIKQEATWYTKPFTFFYVLLNLLRGVGWVESLGEV